MLKQVAEGVLVHESEFIQSNCTVVQGRDGVLLIDPGITVNEMAGIASDLRDVGQPVVAGFSTHPDWDHVLWHPDFGDTPRYGTARCAASIRDVLSQADWRDQVAEGLPPEHAGEIPPMDLLGLITGLPAGATEIPWDGPTVRILEHQAHAPGHAALLVGESGVLVAGDMLSDILMPFLDLEAADPLNDYLKALDQFETVAGNVAAVIPRPWFRGWRCAAAGTHCHGSRVRAGTAGWPRPPRGPARRPICTLGLAAGRAFMATPAVGRKRNEVVQGRIRVYTMSKSCSKGPPG